MKLLFISLHTTPMKTVAKVTRQTLLSVYLLIFMPLHRRWSSKVVTHLCVLKRTAAHVVFPSRNNLTDSSRTVEIEYQLFCTRPVIRITGFSTTLRSTSACLAGSINLHGGFRKFSPPTPYTLDISNFRISCIVRYSIS